MGHGGHMGQGGHNMNQQGHGAHHQMPGFNPHQVGPPVPAPGYLPQGDYSNALIPGQKAPKGGSGAFGAFGKEEHGSKKKVKGGGGMDFESVFGMMSGSYIPFLIIILMMVLMKSGGRDYY